MPDISKSEIISDIIRKSSPGKLSDKIIYKAISHLVSEDNFKTVLNRINSDFHSTANSSSFYTNEKSEEIETNDFFTVSLVRTFGSLENVTSSPSKSLVMLIDCDKDIVLEEYEIDGFPKRGDIPDGVTIQKTGETVFRKGECYLIDKAPRAVSLRTDTGRMLQLRFTLRPEFDLSLSFNKKTLNLTSVNLTDESQTSTSFFAELIQIGRAHV